MSSQSTEVESEISGSALMNVLGAFTSRTLIGLRTEHNLTVIHPSVWYPAEPALALLHELAKAPDGPFTLVSMGITYSSRLRLPSDAREVSTGLLQLCEALYASWRGGSPGEFSVEIKGAAHIRVGVIDSQFPSDLIYGMVYGMCHRLAPAGSDVQIQRIVVNRVTSYDVSWELATAPFKP